MCVSSHVAYNTDFFERWFQLCREIRWENWHFADSLHWPVRNWKSPSEIASSILVNSHCHIMVILLSSPIAVFIKIIIVVTINITLIVITLIIRCRNWHYANICKRLRNCPISRDFIDLFTSKEKSTELLLIIKKNFWHYQHQFLDFLILTQMEVDHSLSWWSCSCWSWWWTWSIMDRKGRCDQSH